MFARHARAHTAAFLVVVMHSETLRERFGRNTANHRTTAGLTQEQLAEIVDVTPVTISNIERGKKSPRFDLIQAIADALCIDPAELFTPGHPDT